MPQYIEIAVVSSTEDGFEMIAGIEAITNSSMAPRYKLVTLHRPQRGDVTQFNKVVPKRIGLWVALDDESMRRCRWRYRFLSCRLGYSRGFYDNSLPEAVVRISNREEFEVLVEKVWDAFCASS